MEGLSSASNAAACTQVELVDFVNVACKRSCVLESITFICMIQVDWFTALHVGHEKGSLTARALLSAMLSLARSLPFRLSTAKSGRVWGIECRLT